MSVFGVYMIGAYLFKGKVPEGLEWKKERNLFFRPYGDGQFLYYRYGYSRPYIVPNNEVRLNIEKKHKLHTKSIFYLFFALMMFWAFFVERENSENPMMIIVSFIVMWMAMTVVSKLIMGPVLKPLARVEKKPRYSERVVEVSDHYSYRHLITQLAIISMICLYPLIGMIQGQITLYKMLLFICILPAVVSYIIMLVVKSRSIFV